jgi:hypothetical protein
MRDVNIGKVRGNVSITDNSSGGGGGLGGLAVAAVVVIGGLALISAAVSAALAALQAIVMMIIWACAGVFALGATGAALALAFKYRHPISRVLGLDAASRALGTSRRQLPPPTGRPGRVLVEVDRADAERLRQLRSGS